MQTWQIGDITVTRLVELEIPATGKDFLPDATPEALDRIDWLRPDFVNEAGQLLMSIHALLVETPDMRLVVDTCLGNDKPRKMTGDKPLQTRFLQNLEAAGWSRHTVDAVVCTHLHVDHVGWNTMKVDDRWEPTFPNARYLIGREEYRYWSQSDSEDQKPVMADSVAPIFDAGLAELVDMDHTVSPHIRLQPTPGHTPGHVSVVLESNGERALITGDFIHHPCQMAQPDWCVVFDEDAVAASAMRKQQLAALADGERPTLVIGTHFAGPTAGHVVRDGQTFRLET